MQYFVCLCLHLYKISFNVRSLFGWRRVPFFLIFFIPRQSGLFPPTCDRRWIMVNTLKGGWHNFATCIWRNLIRRRRSNFYQLTANPNICSKISGNTLLARDESYAMDTRTNYPLPMWIHIVTLNIASVFISGQRNTIIEYKYNCSCG